MATAMESAALEAASMRLSQDVNNAVNEALQGVQDYVAFNLQRAYYKCASRCFDVPKRSEDISRCVQQCGVPLERANGVINNELARFQDRLQRSVMVCRDRMEEQRDKLGDPSREPPELVKGAQACVERSVQEHLSMLPKIADRIKSQITIKDETA